MPPMRNRQAALMSSHGTVTFRVGSGIVDAVELYDEQDPDGWSLREIRVVDVREWERQYGEKLREASYDILDFGYWYQDPITRTTDYEPPTEDWRQQYRQAQPALEPLPAHVGAEKEYDATLLLSGYFLSNREENIARHFFRAGWNSRIQELP